MIEFMRRQRKRSKFDVAPLIDVVFLLLIFFMLTFAIQGEGMDINLPEGQASFLRREYTCRVGERRALRRPLPCGLPQTYFTRDITRELRGRWEDVIHA